MDPIVMCAVLGLALIALLVPTLEYEVRLGRRAKADYLKARGTIHRKILQNHLSKINQRISKLEAEVHSLITPKEKLEVERKRELEDKLTMHLVNEDLDKVPGIGHVLKERIIQQCFDGTLESISNSHLVHGVGGRKYAAIREWVEKTKLKMPHLLLEDFQGKAEIVEKYDNMESELEDELKSGDLELRRLERLRDAATATVNSLEAVDASHFLAAYRGNSRAAEMVTRYLVGVYPEWGSMPSWLKTLTEMSEEA